MEGNPSEMLDKGPLVLLACSTSVLDDCGGNMLVRGTLVENEQGRQSYLCELYIEI